MSATLIGSLSHVPADAVSSRSRLAGRILTGCST